MEIQPPILTFSTGPNVGSKVPLLLPSQVGRLTVGGVGNGTMEL